MNARGKLVGVFAAFLLAFAGGCSGRTVSSGKGSETNWLSVCSSDAECRVGQCVCGVCTTPCGAEGSCPGGDGPDTCATRQSSAFSALCGTTATGPSGVCVNRCGNRVSCATGLACVNGACLPASSNGARSGDSGSTAPPVGTQSCIDLSNLPSTPISFRNDLMPIFGLSCIASACHDQSARKAGLVLGDPSACGMPTCFDASAKWNYSFPAPLPEALVAEVMDGLVNKPSATVPIVDLVVPAAPERSFLLDKMLDIQNSAPYANQCQNQDTSVSLGPCGAGMPLGVPSFCENSPDVVAAIAGWIAQGAQNN